jgi:5'-methylthioadenosine phosphorylase
MVTDWDSWREDTAEVEATQILAVMAANAGLARDTVRRLAAALPETREASPLDGLPASAILTAPEARDKERAAKLGL